MRRRVWVLLCLIGGCALAAAPYAVGAPEEGASPNLEVGSGPFEFDLDAGPGRYQVRFIQTPNGGFTLKGFIQFVSVQKGEHWAPMAAVDLTGADGPFYAGLLAFVDSRAPDKIAIATRDQRIQGHATFVRTHLDNLLIPFELRLDKSGVLRVSVANKSGMTLSVRPFEITRVRFHASTAHIRFSHVEIMAAD